MPTPFYHLQIAQALLEHPNLRPEVHSQIACAFPAFLLGNVAPDVQMISGQSRESTHFFRLPIEQNTIPAWQSIFIEQPSLRPGQVTDMEQRVFVFGYLCHLQADWLWVQQIFEPYFGPQAAWKKLRERLYLHNVLRAHLDFGALEKLNGQVRSGLEQVHLEDWLPFVSPCHLRAWQAFLVDQLKPGAPIQTVQVFAARQGISVEAYYRLLRAEDEMQRQIFDFFPREELGHFWENLIARNLQLLNHACVALT